MTPEEKKRLQREFLIRMGLFIGIKAGIALVLYKWSKSAGVVEIDESAEWFIEPFTFSTLDGSLGGIVRVVDER